MGRWVRLDGRRAATEAGAVAAVATVTAFVLERFATSAWADHFLFGGDSVLLPLVVRSVTSGERLDWTFSSSTFVFPELPMYALADLVTPSTRWALLVNAVGIALALYVLLRLVLACLPEVSARRGRLVALGVVASLAVCVALERDAVPLTSVAFTLFYGTYYVGVALVGLALLAIWLRRDRHRARGGVIALGGGLTAACAASDPLLITHVAIPLCLAAITSRRVVAHRSTLPGVFDAGWQAGGVALGLLLRATVFRGVIANGVGSYVGGPRQGVDRLGDLLSAQIDDPRLRLELIYLVALTAWAVGRPVWAAVTKRDAHMSASACFVTDFAGWSALSVLGVQLVTGNLLSRYMGVLLIFPPLSLATLTVRRPLAVACRWAVVAAVSLIGLRGAIGVGQVRQFAERQPPGTACLEASVRPGDADGVAHFWRARGFDAHLTDPRVLQVNPDFTVYHWLVNAGAYDGREFGFVLVDVDTSRQPGITAADALGGLGQPDAVDSCGAFEVWHYGPANPGRAALNERISATI